MDGVTVSLAAQTEVIADFFQGQTLRQQARRARVAQHMRAIVG